MSETKRSKLSCLGIFRRRRSNSTSKSPSGKNDTASRHAEPTPRPPRSISMQNMERSKSSDSLVSVASVDLAFTHGVLDSFAKISTVEKVRRRHSGNLRLEKMVMTPYFGHFAGQRIHFDLKRKGDFLVNIKVRTEDQILASLLHRQGRKKETVRDQCIKFAHEATTKLTNQKPAPLSFLCEQTIILNLGDIPHWHLPPRYKCQFDIDCQTVNIHVFPSSMHPSPIIMKLKRNISVRELQWMLSLKLHLNPLAITLYIKDSLETLPALSPLPINLSQLVCIITPSAQQSVNDLCVCVSLIGRDAKEIRVQTSTTLIEFEEMIKEEFELHPNSFVYLPDVLSQHNGSYSSHCPLRMHAVLDSTSSSVLLLDHHRRNFPTLHGHLTVSKQQTLQSLLLYRMTVNELDLLKSGPIICFEVNGPTIPIAFKTMFDYDGDPTRCFSVVGIRTHAVSVNPDWSIPILLKYLTCISGFPCNVIKIDDRILEKTVSSDLLPFQWFTVKSNNSYILPNNIPCAQPS